ncbi:SAF domain-containing protein [Nocardioides sp.]|uniref:SAF domain-containing protein n=1 Tax=Nocardioides sp. TaxID=35761 RepID=UPI00356A650B
MPDLRDRLDRLTRPLRRAVLRRRRLLAAVLAAVTVGSGLQVAAGPAPRGVPVLVAARDLPGGQLVAPDDLQEVEFRAESVPGGLAPDPVGRVLAGPMRRGEPLTDVRLVGPGLTAGHAGLVALPVRLPDAAMVELLRVGDRIDLLATDPRGAQAEVVARDLPVLALPERAGAGGVDTLAGRIVVLGATDSATTAIAAAAVKTVLTVSFSR